MGATGFKEKGKILIDLCEVEQAKDGNDKSCVITQNAEEGEERSSKRKRSSGRV